MHYKSFEQTPDIHEPGSARLWHSFRIVHSMVGMWEGWREDDDEGKTRVMKARTKGDFNAQYVPRPPKKKKTKSGKGHDAP